MAFLWVSPILLFVALLASKRMTALPASILALTTAVIIVYAAAPLPTSLTNITGILVAGAWIALPAVVVILAGLVFVELVSPATETPAAPAEKDKARQLGTQCLFIGPFVETATGFGIGFVFALRGVLALNIKPGPAMALAAFSQCLVPWGALGVGTRISAALIDAPLLEITQPTAIIMAPILALTVWFYWQCASAAGTPIPRRQKLEDACLFALLAGVLIITNSFLPVELAGLFAIAIIVLLRLWLQNGGELMTATMLSKAAPYGALIAILALTRLHPDIENFLSNPSYTPGHGAPSFAPLLSPAIPLILIAIVTNSMLQQRRQTGIAITDAIAKGWRASLLTFTLVALAWLFVQSGIATAIAQDLRSGLGSLSPAIIPLLGALGGYLTGSNAGAGSLSMPVAAALSYSPIQLYWSSAAAIAAGSILTAISPVRLAMGKALTNAQQQDMDIALKLLVPYTASCITVAVLVAWAIAVLG
ncbi:MAG: L-lactate permease [Filomicrobium sp.]